MTIFRSSRHSSDIAKTVLLFAIAISESSHLGCDVRRAPTNRPAASAKQPQPAPKQPESQLEKQPIVEDAAEVKQTTAPEVAIWEPTGNWTKQRLIVLGEAGPTVIDLSASIGQQDLMEATNELQARIASELVPALIAGTASPTAEVTWEELLEMPLVQSGWLGNLVAESEQKEQLISMYDTQRDGLVSLDELPAFLSRGLARSKPLQVSDVGHELPQTSELSPWGKSDLNQDYSLDTRERENLIATVQQQDVNADGVISRAEVANRPDMNMQSPASNQSSLLRTTTLMVWENATDSSVEKNKKTHRKFAVDIIRHYTFLAELAREQWFAWNDATWQSVDSNADNKIDAAELERIVAMPPHAEIFLRLPGIRDGAEGVQMQLNVKNNDPEIVWERNERGGTLTGGSCSLRIDVTDAYSLVGKQQLRLQLNQALKNEQVKAFLVRQLQLQESAFDFLDTDEDSLINEEELERAWGWLTSRQSSRLLGKWMLSDAPWFQLVDQNGDSRLSEVELRGFADRVRYMDRNQDGQVTPNELPLVARLELNRTDQRLTSPLISNPQTDTTVADSDWFSAMDTNRDSYVSTLEFLGESADFNEIDSDRDGFLSRNEAFSLNKDGTK